MNAEDLLSLLLQKGARLSPRIHVEAPAGAITLDLRNELAAHRDEVLARMLIGDEAGSAAMQHLRDLYRAACFELAETLGWPQLGIDPPKTVPGGDANWRLYLNRASIPELRDQVLPRLRSMLDQIPPPEEQVQ